MSTLDVVNQVGGQAANFLDIGGGANADVMAAALEVINSDESRALDLHQHLRRHHPGRGGGQGHRGGARTGRPAGADGDPPGRHQRRGGPRASWPTPASRRPLITKPTMLDAAEAAVALAGGDANAEELPWPSSSTQDTKVIVQGLTGGQGRFHGLRNRDYGTQVVAGVTPGKGGQDVEGIPIFDTVAEAVAATGADASLRRRAAQGRAGRHPRGGRRGHRLRGVHHRGHPGPGRGQGLQPA